MASPAGVAWVEVLPSFGGFSAAVAAGTRVPLAAAGRTAGTQYGSSLTAAARSSLTALSGTVAKQTGAAAAGAAKSVEAAEAKMRAARMKSQDVAGKLRVEEMRLEEIRSKSGASAGQVASAEARVAKAKSLCAKADAEATAAGRALYAARNGSARETAAEIAASEKLALARQREVAATSAVTVAAAKLADLRAKETAGNARVAEAEARVTASRDKVRLATQALAAEQAKIGPQSAKIEANAKKLQLAEKQVADAQKAAAAAAKQLQAARNGGVSASQLAAAEEKVAVAQRGAAAASATASKAALELSAAEKVAASSATVAATRFGALNAAVMSGTTSMAGKVAGFSKAAAGMAGMIGAFSAVHFAGESMHAAQEFQKGANVLVTAAGEAQSNLGMIQAGLLKISSQTGTSTEQMVEGMYTVEKAGYRAKAGLAVMDAAAKGARDEGADLHTVTNALTTVMSNEGIAAQDSAKAMNAVMVAAGHSKVSLQDFSGSLSNVLAIAKGTKISLADVSGAISVMTAKGMSAQAATDTLKSTIQGLIRPNTAMSNAMSAFGISSQDVSDKLGVRGLQGTMEYLSKTVKDQMGPSVAAAADTLKTMPEKLQGLYAGLQMGTTTISQFEKAIRSTKGATDAQKKAWAEAVPGAMSYNTAMARITGRTTGFQTALMLTSDTTRMYAKTHEEVQHALSSTEHFEHKWHQTTQTAAASLAIAKQTVHNMGVELALKLMPAVAAAAKGFTFLVTGVDRIARANWGWIKWVAAGLLGIVGAVWAYNAALWAVGAATAAATTAQTVFAIATGTASIAQMEAFLATRLGTGVLWAYTAATKAAAAAQWLWDAALEGNPIVLIISALVALGVAAVVAYKKSETFRNIVQGAFHAIGAAGLWMWNNALKPAFSAIQTAASWIWDRGLKPAFSALQTALGFVGKHWKIFAAVIAAPLAPVILPLVGAFKLLQRYGGDALSLLGTVASWLWRSVLKPTFSAITTAIGFLVKHWKVFATILAIPLTPIIVPLVAVFKLLKTHGMDALRAVGAAGLWLWNTALKPTFSAIGALASWLWANALKPALSGAGSGLKTLGSWAMWLWNNAISPAFHAIAALASWLWVNAIRPAITGIWGGMQSLAKIVRWVWMNGFEASFRAIGKVATWLWSSVLKPTFSAIATLATWLWHYVIGPIVVIAIMAIQGLAKVVTWLWSTCISPIFRLIGALASWLWANAIRPVVSAIVTGFQNLGKWAMWLWHNGIQPAFNGAASAVSWAWNHIISPALGLIVRGFQNIVTWAMWLWHNGIQPAFNGAASAVSWAWNHIISPAIGLIVRGFQNLAKWAMWLWKNGVKPAFDGLGAAVRWVYDHVVSPAFNAFQDALGRSDKQGLRGAFHTAVDAIGKIWDGLKDAFRKPINGVIKIATDYFVNPFNKIAGSIGVAKIPDLPKVATGGEIPGPYMGPTADNVLGVSDAGIPVARVNPREYITNVASTASMKRHHPGALEHINATGRLPGYAGGGQVAAGLEGLPRYFPGGDVIKSGINMTKKAVHAVAHPIDTVKSAAKTAKDVVEGTLTGNALTIARIVKFAMQQVGKPYVWAAAGPSAYDCSGLTSTAYRSGGGPSIPHLADAQAHMGRPVSRDKIQPGDLLFPRSGHPVPHVAMAVTPNAMVHASSPKVGVVGPQPIPALPNGARRILGDVNSTEVAGIVKGLGAIDMVKGAYSDAVSWMFEKMRGVLDTPINAVMKKFGDHMPVQMVGGEAKHLLDGAITWAEGMLGASGPSGTASEGASEAVAGSKPAAAWRPQIEQALRLNGLTPTPDLVARWERQVQSESSGNPNAIQGNIGDVNNKSGDLARGLVQVSGAAWHDFHVPGTSNNRFDPVANLAAGINVAKHSRYGMSQIGNGHGYGLARGGMVPGYAIGTTHAAPGVAEVAEDGAEIVFGRQYRKFKGGEQVYNRAQIGKLVGARRQNDGDDGGIQVNITGVPMDAATEISNEIGFNLRRLDYAGRYERV